MPAADKSVRTTIRLSPAVHRDLKVRAARDRKTIQELVEALILRHLGKTS